MEAMIYKALSYGWVLAGYIFWKMWDEQKVKIDKQQTKLEELQKKHNEFVTETEAKDMIREIVEPIISDQKELKQDIKQILAALTDIQRDLAIAAALREHEKSTNNLDNHKEGK
jgi:hypothetical protein